jgi:hypothetical protein
MLNRADAISNNADVFPGTWRTGTIYEKATPLQILMYELRRVAIGPILLKNSSIVGK